MLCRQSEKKHDWKGMSWAGTCGSMGRTGIQYVHLPESEKVSDEFNIKLMKISNVQ